jgi:hypothetical protein
VTEVMLMLSEERPRLSAVISEKALRTPWSTSLADRPCKSVEAESLATTELTVGLGVGTLGLLTGGVRVGEREGARVGLIEMVGA